MTDNTDLLRRLGDNIAIGKDGRLVLTDEHVRSMREAADAIEAQDKTIAELREQVAACTQGSDLGYTRLENVGLRKRAEAAEADSAALRQDAERYRWIRNQKESLFYLIPGAADSFGFVDLVDFPQFDELDAAVDTAMGDDAALLAGKEKA